MRYILMRRSVGGNRLASVFFVRTTMDTPVGVRLTTHRRYGAYAEALRVRGVKEVSKLVYQFICVLR